MPFENYSKDDEYKRHRLNQIRQGKKLWIGWFQRRPKPGKPPEHMDVKRAGGFAKSLLI